MLFKFMHRIVSLKRLAGCFGWAFGFAASIAVPLGAASQVQTSPNVVMIVADDLGYADVGCFSNKGVSLTPSLDRLAERGVRLTQFYVSQAVCTASRAAFMTGCYANRVGLQGALNHTSRNGINAAEYLMPEMFRDAGYATACFGKWHLGTVPDFLPLRHGFDEFFGIPYSNDNSKYHPTVHDMPPLPLYEGDSTVELDPDQSLFTSRITDHAVSFIERRRDRPFFLYVPHVMPHVPIFPAKEFDGKTGRGRYADVVSELDASIERILATLERCGVADNTIVVFFSDNGPFLSYGDHAGRATPLREGKLTSFDGGVKVPCIVRWPGHIDGGRTVTEPVLAIDLLPTFTSIVGGRSSEFKLDGKNALRWLANQPGPSEPLHESIVFYAGTELQAIRSGKWKLHFAHRYLTVNGPPGTGGKPANWANMKPEKIEKSGIDGIASRHGYKIENLELSLFDLDSDPGETVNVASQHPDVVGLLSDLAKPFRAEMGDSITGTVGTAIRPAGIAE